MVRVLIADDHPIVRSGIRTELLRNEDFDIVGEAENGKDALKMAKELQFGPSKPPTSFQQLPTTHLSIKHIFVSRGG